MQRHTEITTTTAITTPPSLPCHIPSLLSALAGCGLVSLGGVLGLVPRPCLPPLRFASLLLTVLYLAGVEDLIKLVSTILGRTTF